jgi:hypothetical protein
MRAVKLWPGQLAYLPRPNFKDKSYSDQSPKTQSYCWPLGSGHLKHRKCSCNQLCVSSFADVSIRLPGLSPNKTHATYVPHLSPMLGILNHAKQIILHNVQSCKYYNPLPAPGNASNKLASYLTSCGQLKVESTGLKASVNV